MKYERGVDLGKRKSLVRHTSEGGPELTVNGISSSGGKGIIQIMLEVLE